MALFGGPSLVAATKPRFRAEFRHVAEPGCGAALVGGEVSFPFHPDSPAGSLWAELKAIVSAHCARRGDKASPLARVRLDWHDPYAGKGGLGASTAQFAAVAAFGESLAAWSLGLISQESQTVRSFGERPIAPPDWDQALKLYRRHAWNGDGKAPSGADLVAQVAGGLCVFPEPGHGPGRPTLSQPRVQAEARVFEWPFDGLAFTFLRTGAKVPTHEHLRSANASSWPLDELREISRRAISILGDARSGGVGGTAGKAFAEAVQGYGETLAKAGLCTEATLDLIAEARSRLGPDVVLAAKGCGAMGADILAIVHPADAFASVQEWADSRRDCGLSARNGRSPSAATSLAVVGTSRDLSAGLRFERPPQTEGTGHTPCPPR